jgi:hypothetical protein
VVSSGLKKAFDYLNPTLQRSSKWVYFVDA